VKPEFEDDFIVYWNPEQGFGEFSNKGRYKGGVESVCLYQLNSKGELVYVANCASGLTEEMKTNIKPSTEPIGVWKIIYSGRRYVSDGDKTNALDFPRFDSIRTDKAPGECTNPKL
jgi:ATP-dependent DNA ligase